MKDNTGPSIPSMESDSEGRNSELVSRFPIFDKTLLDGEKIYLERSLYRNISEGEDRFKDEDARFFLMPSGPLLLSSASLTSSQDLWSISEKDKTILGRLEAFVQEHKGETEPSIFQLGNQRNYRADVFSYDDPNSMKRLNDLLEDKMRKRKAMNK
jgi:hypothetical protein